MNFQRQAARARGKRGKALAVILAIDDPFACAECGARLTEGYVSGDYKIRCGVCQRAGLSAVLGDALKSGRAPRRSER
jgi:hypothetical protein